MSKEGKEFVGEVLGGHEELYQREFRKEDTGLLGQSVGGK